MEETREIPKDELNCEEFVEQKIKEIKEAVGDRQIINALSGGVDSSVVTMLADRAVGKQLKTYFIENGLMRKDEARYVKGVFESMGIDVEIYDASDTFFAALRTLTDPEEKREAITQTFYKYVFGLIVRESGVKFLLQGTNLTDVEETVAGIKRQHNVLAQLGIDTEEVFGYKVIEPLIQLRKDGIRKLGRHLGLPVDIYERKPFPGPALAARVHGEVTREKIRIIRKATSIVEHVLSLPYIFTKGKLFQSMTILHEDKPTGMRDGKRQQGYQVEIRCWESIDARTAQPMELFWSVLRQMADKITSEVPEVVSVTYNITPKPPSTMEAI